MRQHRDLDEVFRRLVYDPGFCWDLAKQGSEAWQRWIKSNIFYYLTKVAKEFEEGVAYNTFRSVNGLTNLQIVRQVTLEISGIGPNGQQVKAKIRLDYIGKNTVTGKFHFGEAKFSTHATNWVNDWLSSCTKNQQKVFPLFQSNDNITSIVVKASDSKKIQDLKDILNLNPNDLINLNDIGSFKLFGGHKTFESIESFGKNTDNLSISQIIDLKN